VFVAADALFVSLQYGRIEKELSDVRSAMGWDIYSDPEIDPLLDPDASAAQISAMDLVLTTSNTTAHFAGALHVPVWVFAPLGPGALWYWFTEGATSPWYPSMRLIRQRRPGQWADVIQEAARGLRDWGRW
jgi:hypothetical protein